MFLKIRLSFPFRLCQMFLPILALYVKIFYLEKK